MADQNIQLKDRAKTNNLYPKTKAALVDGLQATIQSYVASAGLLTRQVVASLPTTGDPSVIYMVLRTPAGSQGDVYDQFMWIENTWQQIGDTSVDLSGYYTSAQVDTLLTAKASLSGATFTGIVLAPTPIDTSNNTTVATTAFVVTAISGKADSATTLAGYGITDAYTKTQTDGYLALKAPLASPTFTGIPKAPTAAAGTSTTQLATTQFVANATAGIASDATVQALSDRVDDLQTTMPTKAPLASPALTGTPTAPTAAAGTNTTQVATTAFVKAATTAAVADKADKATTLAGYGITDAYTQTKVNELLAPKAPLASPALTGTPTAPTATAGTSTTQVATTAFVQGQISGFISYDVIS